jgi:SAM-dependent methyltransferase
MDFVRYLEAKQSLDDRSLHPRVWGEFCRRVKVRGDILDIGCGLGATLDRLLTHMAPGSHFTGIDCDESVIDIAKDRHVDVLNASFRVAELTDFARSTRHQGSWPIITAHAFLDLVNLNQALDDLTALLTPDGLVYFSVNFDDLTVIEPLIDAPMDQAVLSVYHRAMYAQEWGGNGGDGRTGRRLIHALSARGFDLLDIGPSDWVIAPVKGKYRDGDAVVLEYLLDHIVEVVRANRAFADDELAAWAAERTRQLGAAELVYIAHQLDVLAERRPALSH